MSEPDAGEWFGGKRWTGYAAIGMIAVLLLCIAFVVYKSATQHDPAKPAALPNAAASSSTSPGVPHGAPSRVDTSQLVPSSSPPAGVTWSLISGYAIPSSPTDGPFTLDGLAASGYAHTPTGALLALANGVLRMTVASGSPTCSAVVAAAVEAAQATAAQQSVCTDVAGAPEQYQIVGYQFISYTPTQAAIAYAGRDESTADMFEVSATLIWSGGTWALTVPGANGGGNPLGPTAAIDSLVGLVPWSGA